MSMSALIMKRFLSVTINPTDGDANTSLKRPSSVSTHIHKHMSPPEHISWSSLASPNHNVNVSQSLPAVPATIL